jgi:FkbM family methyltransferase
LADDAGVDEGAVPLPAYALAHARGEVMGWTYRLAGNLRAAAALHHAGVTLPSLVMFLRRNVEVNRLANIRIVQAACAAQSAGRRQLYGRGDTALTTLYDRDLLGSRFRSVAEVDAVTLEGLFAAETVEKCDLLKLDCEGAEYEILLNAPPKILQRVSRIALEYHLGMNSHDPAELSAFLRAQGFTVTCEPPLDAESGYLYAARQPAGMMSSRVSA